MKEEKSLRELINPFPRQEEFLKTIDKYKFVLYGGAKHGGKSYILRWALVRQLLIWASQGHRKVRVGLFCENYPTLQDRQITKIEKEFPRWLGRLTDSRVEGLSFILRDRFGGGIIALRNLDDVSKYSGSEFAMAAIDQVEKNKREVFDEFRSIIRWPDIRNTKFIASSNPGGIGHDWVKKLWIDRSFTPQDPDPKEIEFIRSLPSDNPYTTQEYLDELSRLPEALKKAYRDGNWDVFAGQYFNEWDIFKHVETPFPIPSSYKRFRSYDHGREAPACCSWYALDYDGRVHKYREFYQSGLNVDQIATEIQRLSEGETYEYSVADPSIFAKMGFVDKYGGQTIAETFARYGIIYLPASNRRIDGWNLLHQYLYWDDTKEPRIKYFSTCHDSIRTLPLLLHDQHKPEDVDSRGEDHAADADRYFLMSLHERFTPKPKTELERYLDRRKQEQSIYPATLKTFYKGEL